ncbi:MAG: DUF3750 domain-containing protein [Gammaproteobacteria bacterium]
MKRRRFRQVLVGILALTLLGPLLVAASGTVKLGADWRTASRASVGLAPDPATTREAVVQVYAARAFDWRGLFAVHTWLATKARDADHYVVHQVLGWNQWAGLPVVESRADVPDRRWYDAAPVLLRDVRGAAAESLLPALDAAVARYPHTHGYRLWPGPNSNTFVAAVAREVPALGLSLPGTAIGKDYLAGGAWWGPAPSGSGYQVSLFGYVGLLLAREEGLELNLLGAVFGLDPRALGVKLPGVGAVGLRRVAR